MDRMGVWRVWRDEVVAVRIRMGSDRAKKAIHIDLATVIAAWSLLKACRDML